MVFFCVMGVLFIFVFLIVYLWFGSFFGMNLCLVLLMLEKLKEWVMLDIYFIGMVVVCIKVKEYVDVMVGIGLIVYLMLILLSILVLVYFNLE